ncbi:MAG: phosphate acyltransferase PlsX [Coriobacteriales bacterium]|jgi:glycerol-3-phosphate acyltransferase PlsX|nr:phosphate acyltransferase PlsX [Coriobacteriales bacterium]
MIQNDTIITIAVDALGGDDAPRVVLEGVEQALALDSALHILLTGPAEVVEPFAASNTRVEAVSTSEAIAMDEHPAQAVRRKKDSSIVVGCKLVKEGRAQGFFSAGSTGACMAAATLYIGRIRGVARPAIVSVLPAPAGPVVLTDIGANADVKPDYLVQFAQMAAVYAERICGIDAPRIGLLNIGSEDSKGSQLAQEAHRLLAKKLPGFKGNVEGTDLFGGDFDVVVTDGFTGNVVLKTIEGTVSTLFGLLKEALTATTIRKLGASLVMSGLRDLKKTFSADEVGGAPLLGVAGSCIIGHGSSSAHAIASGIAATTACVRAEVPRQIAESID